MTRRHGRLRRLRRWAQTYYDGLGRTVQVRSGTGSDIKSIVETEYAACACSPLGKVWRVTQPFTPSATVVYWTSYTYDELGRTVSVIQPNGAGTTTYGYWDNNVAVTDPAGKWKTMTVDGFGNLEHFQSFYSPYPQWRKQLAAS